MRFGFYDEFRPCLVKQDGVVDISDLVGAFPGAPPQFVLETLINKFDQLRGKLKEAETSGKKIPMTQVRLRAPVPRPGKVLCGRRNFMEGIPLDPPGPLRTFFKSPDAVIGPGETVILPAFRASVFNHEAELALVIGKEAKDVPVEKAMDHVFGYTTSGDVSARGPVDGEAELSGPYGKCFDTFLPLGPAIVTPDEVGDPNKLQIKFWVNGQLRQDYNTEDMEHSVAFMISTLSHNMTLKTGDLILVGVNHSHLGPLQDGDIAEIDIEKVGRMSHHVSDPSKRTWPLNLRDPQVNIRRREGMKGKPHSGTWPLQPATGVVEKGGAH
jgi:2-keto-4-pentenoate hydratase/2-oxohepta-3-ene-1,7-dioic acid hydratase in catechol pathway